MARAETTTAPAEASGTDMPGRAARVVMFQWEPVELPDEAPARFGVAGEVTAAVSGVVALWQVGPVAATDVGKIVFHLLANALRHGAAPISVVVDQGFTGAVNIAVSDASDAMPRLLDQDPTARGRSGGLALVDGLAHTWDVYAHEGGGKTVHAVVVPSARSGRSRSAALPSGRRTRGSRAATGNLPTERGERE